MSDPEPTAAGPSRTARPTPPEPPARWLDRASALLLCVAVAVTLASATPALLRALGVPLPRNAAPAEGPPIVLPRQPPELLANPDPMLDDLDPEETHVLRGRARGRLTLHDEPTAAGHPQGEVKAGELVMIVREAGDWVLVVHDGDERVVSGWAKKSEIAVR